MKRRQLAIGSVAIVAAAAGAGWGWWRNRPSAISQRSLWTLRFDQPGGGELAMTSFQGHPLLLNFWATWCPPCIKEMPMLDAFFQQHRSKGWQVLGLAVDRASPVREFLSRTAVAFPIGLADMAGIDLARSLGNTNGGLPFSIAFDSQGHAVGHKLGGLTQKDLATWAAQIG